MNDLDKPADVANCGILLGGDNIWRCEKCALACDEGDKRPPCETLTYSRLLDVVMDEASRIEAAQDALIATGDRKFRHQGQMKHMMELRAVARLIVKMQDQKQPQKASS